MPAAAHRLLLAVAWLLAAGGVPAGDPPTAEEQSPNYSRAAASRGWSAHVHGSEAAKPVAEGPAEFVLRLYAGDRAAVEDLDGRALALEVRTEIERCADGSTRVNGVQVGSWRYALAGSCPKAPGSRIRVLHPAGESAAESGAVRLHCTTARLSCQPDAG